MQPNNVNFTVSAEAQEANTNVTHDVALNRLALVRNAIGSSHPSSNPQAAAFTVPAQNTSSRAAQQATDDRTASDNPLNALSRVILATVKYPDETTLCDYADLQMWMYLHGNKRPLTDICETVIRTFVSYPSRARDRAVFNSHLICAEVYQTLGLVQQARAVYDQLEILEKAMERSTEILTRNELLERERIRKKKDDIEMKLEFQAQFFLHLNYAKSRSRFNITAQSDILGKLAIDNPTPEECRLIWRQIVLELALQPEVAKPCAQWLLSYAQRHSPTTLQHANCLYVALNLFLMGYGSEIFQHANTAHIDVFEMLDNIGRYFDENGHQSKQFSPVHKMAHVWGTAAVAFHLSLNTYSAQICASMMRASFESLNISFLSSGIESLYLLARTHAPDFFNLMATQPNIQSMQPSCINYVRRRLRQCDSCIRYSKATVDQLVVDAFNFDMTDRRA